jgi:hypothetical protein
LVTTRKAIRIGKRLGVDFKQIPVEQFRRGIGVEGREHRDVTRGKPATAARIALAHLHEFPDYYSRLEKMEKDAKR